MVRTKSGQTYLPMDGKMHARVQARTHANTQNYHSEDMVL